MCAQSNESLSWYKNTTELCAEESSNVSPRFRSTYFVVATSLVSITGTMGNSLILLALGSEKKLRTVYNCLIGHLSLVDLLVCALQIPGMVIMASTEFSITACSQWLQFIPFLPTVSAFTQSLVCVNRYFLVAKDWPTNRKWFSLRSSVIYMASGWLLCAFGVGIISRFNSKPIRGGVCYCSSFTTVQESKKVGSIFLVCFCVLFFSIAMECGRRLKTHVRKHEITLSRKNRLEYRTSKIIFLLLLLSMFTMVMSPLALVVASHLSKYKTAPAVIEQVGAVIYGLSYCVNPIFYFLKIEKYRTTLKRLFSWQHKKQQYRGGRSNGSGRMEAPTGQYGVSQTISSMRFTENRRIEAPTAPRLFVTTDCSSSVV